MADHEETIRTMAVQVALIEERCRVLPDLVKRVDDLERKDIKRTAYAGALGAVTAFAISAIGWLLERLHVFVMIVFVLLTSCALPEYIRQDGPHWPAYRRPVTVKIDSSMDAECLAAVDFALSWWADQGVDWLVPDYVASYDPSVNGLTKINEIGISQGELSPGVAGETRWFSLRATNHMIYADIVLAQCNRETAAHELGHALGLKHEDDTVTCWNLGCHQWYLSPAQQEHVK